MHLRRIALLCLGSLPGGLVSAAQPPAQSSAGEQLQQLVTAEKAAVDNGDATQILTEGTQLGYLALELLGQMSLDQQKCGAAADAFAHALELPALHPAEQQWHTRLSLVTAATCAGRSAQAAAQSDQFLQLAGETAQAHTLLAGAHHAADDLPGTILELEHAAALDPNYLAAHQALGNAYWELNEYQYNEETLREFTTAQRLAPGDASANENLGAVLSQYQRYAEAAPFLQKAAVNDPENPDPWLEIGMDAFAQGANDEAARALTTAVSLTGTDRERNNYQIRRAFAVLSRIAAAQGDQAAAQRNASEEEAIHADMVHRQAFVPLTESTALGSVQAHAAARRLGAPAAESASSANGQVESTLKTILATSLNDAGTALARQRDYAGALPFFRIAAAARPEQPPMQRNLGLAAFHTGAWREAADALSAALVQNPEDALARADLEQARIHLATPAIAP